MIRRSVARMTAYTPGEQPGGAVVKLNTNENPYPPSPRVGEALRAFEADGLRRYASPTAAPVREAVARLHGCASERVFAGNGSDEILALCTRAFVEHDGAIGYFTPSYSLYPVLTDIREVAHRPVPLGPGATWSEPPADAGTLFFITTPNAPTGIQYPLETVAAFCERFQGVVVIDEAYVDFAETDCLALTKTFDHVLVTRTLSKSYSLAALRVGYAIGHPDLIRALDTIKDSYNLNAVSQRLAVAALGDQEWMRTCRVRILATRARLTDALADRGFVVSPSAANFVWARAPEGRAQACYETLRAQGIYIRYFPGPVTGEHVRITVGTDDEIDKLIAALDRLG